MNGATLPLPTQTVSPDTFTPHDDPKQRPLGIPPDSSKGIDDPRKLPKQEIFEPNEPDVPQTEPIPDFTDPDRVQE